MRIRSAAVMLVFTVVLVGIAGIAHSWSAGHAHAGRGPSGGPSGGPSTDVSSRTSGTVSAAPPPGAAAPTPPSSAVLSPAHNLIAAIPDQASSSTSPGCGIPPVIAHRGEGGNPGDFPENTSWSEVDAARHGADVLNLDVRWTADGVPVALHDPTVDRTTSGTGPITGYTAARFTALTSRDNSGRIRPGLHPQTLAQVLAGVRPTGLPIVIQIESDPLNGADPVPAQTQFAHFAQVIKASGLGPRIVVAGWTAPDLVAFHLAAPSVPTAFLQNAGDPTPDSILSAGARILYIQYTGITAAQVADWHQAGLVVWAWTPPSSSEWATLSRDHVDAIATNWVPDYVHWARGACSSVRGG